MAKNYYQDGNTLDWSNSTTKDVLSGQAVTVGALVGVAHEDIPVGKPGVLHVTGVFILPKIAADVWTTGTKLFADVDGNLTKTSGTGKTAAGTAWADATADQTSAPVRLGY